MKSQAGAMRLNREAKMAKKEIEAQIKKTGKLNETKFICLPDPQDAYVWYYIIWDLDTPVEYKGGYYLGKVQCPPEYPAKAPQIKIITENGRFRTTGDGICLSVSHFHPESWNPVWKVNQIVLGLQTFWEGGEYTYGSVDDHEFRNKGMNPSQYKKMLAMKSRQAVMDHEIYQMLFKQYGDAIGITQEADYEALGWTEIQKIHEENEARKLKEAEERRITQELKAAEQKREKELADQAAKENL